MKRLRFQQLIAAVRKMHPAALQHLNELTVWDPPAKPRTCLLVSVWLLCLSYTLFLVYWLMLYTLDLGEREGMAWMQMSGVSLAQSLAIGEPLKFCVIAFITSCLPDRAKLQCISCLQACSLCSSLM